MARLFILVPRLCLGIYAFQGSALKIDLFGHHRGGRASESCVPRRSLGTRSRRTDSTEKNAAKCDYSAPSAISAVNDYVGKYGFTRSRTAQCNSSRFPG
jgi:hypothetical protein